MLRGCGKVTERSLSLLRGRVHIDKLATEMGNLNWPLRHLVLQV